MFFGKDVFISLSIVSQESQCVSLETGNYLKPSWLVVIKCFMKDVAASEIDAFLITVSAIICDKFCYRIISCY